MSKGNRVVRASSLPSSRVARRGYAGRDCAVGREHSYDCCIFFFYLDSLRAKRTRKKIVVFCFVDISEGVVNSGVQAKSSRTKIKKKSRYAVYSSLDHLGLLYLSRKTILSVGIDRPKKRAKLTTVFEIELPGRPQSMSHTTSPLVLSSLRFEDLELVLPMSIMFGLSVSCSILWLIGALGEASFTYGGQGRGISLIVSR